MSNNTPDWKKDIERLVKLADDMGRSRGPNNYAMNQSAVNELVDLKMALLARIAELEKDAARLDHIASEYLFIEPFDRPTGGDDADVGWRIRQAHMGENKPRTVAEVFRDDLRAAIDAAKNAA